MQQQLKRTYHENRFERFLRTKYHRVHAAGYAPCAIFTLFFTLSTSIVLYALLGVWTAGIAWVIASAIVLPLSLVGWVMLYVGWRKHHQYLLSQGNWRRWCTKAPTIWFMSILGG